MQLDPDPRVHSLYCTAKLNWEQMARFPRFADFAINRGSGSDKAVMYLYPEMQGQIVRSSALHTIVTPRISHRPQTKLESTRTHAMQRATTITTMSQLPRAGQHTYQFIDRFVARASTLQLILGTNSSHSGDHCWTAGNSPPANVSNREQINSPLISVIIPVVNEARFLPDAVASVLAQNYPAIEIIVVDRGSSYETEDAVNQLPIPVLFFKQRKSGRAAALNRGIREASGQLVTFFDVDNLWPEDHLHIMLEHLLDDASCDVVQGFGQFEKMASATGMSNHVKNPEESPDYITAALYRREAFDTAGLLTMHWGLGKMESGSLAPVASAIKISTSEPSDDVSVPRDEHSPGKVPA